MNTGSQPARSANSSFTEPERTDAEAAGYIVGLFAGPARLIFNRKVIGFFFNRKVIGFLLINGGVFLAVAAFLPRVPTYYYTGPISKFINSRYNWELAWMIPLASSCITLGALLLLRRKKKS